MQERAGVRHLAERGRVGIRPSMPEQHRELFETLPYLVVGALDPSKRPFATMLAGEPGFVRAPTPTSLVVSAVPHEGDPIRGALLPGGAIGLLGIELGTRRRNRANGTLGEVGASRLWVEVEESFGNCPKYIQARTIEGKPRTFGGARREGASLSTRARTLVAAADTCFLASAAPAPSHGRPDTVGPADRCDVSHRGGKPGFLRVDEVRGATVLTMPDFPGNNFFMTLGNLAVRPRVGLAVVDFASGALLSLTGVSEIVWEGEELQSFAGAERLLRVEVESGVLLEGAIPFVWSPPELSPRLAGTGTW